MRPVGLTWGRLIEIQGPMCRTALQPSGLSLCVRAFDAMMRWLWLLGILSIVSGSIGKRPLADGDVPEAIRPFFSPPAPFVGDFSAYRSPLLFSDGSRVRTVEDCHRRREEILATWRELVGFWPPLIEDPNVQFLDQMQQDDLTQYKVTVEIAPNGQTVRGYLLVPKGKGPFPAVLVVYYDAETGVGLGKELRDFGSQLARRGFATLSMGTPAFASLNAPCKPLWDVPAGQPPRQPLSALASMTSSPARRGRIRGLSSTRRGPTSTIGSRGIWGGTQRCSGSGALSARRVLAPVPTSR